MRATRSHSCVATTRCVHAAALPEPTRNPAHTVFQNNVMATFNTLEAAVRFGVARFVHVSSETVPGFFFPERPFLPDYAPIDEEHPVRPQDPYALAKHFGEQLMDAATRRSDLRAISIRPSWVQWEGNIEQNLGPIVRGPAGPSAGLGRDIELYDLAEAAVARVGHRLSHDTYDLADALLLASSRELAGQGRVGHRAAMRARHVEGGPLAEAATSRLRARRDRRPAPLAPASTALPTLLRASVAYRDGMSTPAKQPRTLTALRARSRLPRRRRELSPRALPRLARRARAYDAIELRRSRPPGHVHRQGQAAAGVRPAPLVARLHRRRRAPAPRGAGAPRARRDDGRPAAQRTPAEPSDDRGR